MESIDSTESYGATECGGATERDGATAQLLELLGLSGLSLAVAESLTGGALAAELVRLPGSSAVFWGGVVSYHTRVKQRVLGVDEALLQRVGPVNPEVALQMAEAVRSVISVDGQRASVGIATTGVAGPDSQNQMPVGLVYIAVCTDLQNRVAEFNFVGNRDSIRAKTVAAAVQFAVKILRES